MHMKWRFLEIKKIFRRFVQKNENIWIFMIFKKHWQGFRKSAKRHLKLILYGNSSKCCVEQVVRIIVDDSKFKAFLWKRFKRIVWKSRMKSNDFEFKSKTSISARILVYLFH